MGDHHHRHAAFRQLAHRIQHLLHPLRIQGTGGLIEQHHLRIQGQSPGDRHPLLLTTAELRRVLVGLLANAHLVKEIHRPLLGSRLGTLLHLDRGKGDVVEDGKVREKVELLKHHPHALADLPHLTFCMGGVQANPKHIQGAAIQRLQTVERTNQRALAGAGRPHHHQHFAAVHLKGDAIESSNPLGIALDQISGTNGDSHEAERAGSS